MLRTATLFLFALFVALLPTTAFAHPTRTQTRAASHRGTRTARPIAQERSRAPRAPARQRSNNNTHARARRPARPCLSPAVEIVRVEGTKRESRRLSLTRCNGMPNADAVNELSILARPHGVDRPSARDLRNYERRLPVSGRRARRNVQPSDPAFVVEDVKRLDAGLLVRLQKVATRFPNRAIEVVSGYRANERASSRHHQARAMDIRVRGVSRERLRDFARTLDETGVGYYPNSVFVHVDVRDRRAFWIDRSGPGEEADYGEWPRPATEIATIRANLLERAEDAIARLAQSATEEDAPDMVAPSTEGTPTTESSEPVAVAE